MNRLSKKQKSRSRKKTILYSILIALGAFAILSATYGVYLAKRAEVAADRSYQALADRENGSELREEQVEPLTDNVSILFVGIDDSEKRGFGDETSRSDALMVATLNNEDKTIKLVSIPRDSYVYIPEVGYSDKITHAHAHGGTRVSIETVEELLDIPIDYYVKMNFNAFIDTVDALGGVTVDVPYDHLELDENDEYTVELKEGTQLLDGRETLALARTRKLDNDIERGKRQQMILEAIIKKAASVSSFTKYGDVIDAVGSNMKTDLTFDQMKSFFDYVSKGKPQVETLSLTGYDDMTTGTYYWQLDEESLETTKTELQTHLELKPGSSEYAGDATNNDSE
ncbi:transcriptional regulator [Tetzosporium hominis]|uniref:Transcriptional regulator n=1 Tax=Tetzosporium hominis TaxID=2020506 RepID=A0A264W653_9BACL|nr:LCP family protein [Tetzosporium hominis]OZS79068.1 transcriptional regulator [Tetzosporium hominis]